MIKFRLHLKRRRFFLLFLFILDIVYAYGLLVPGRAEASPTYTFLSNIMPLSLWALLWAVVGINCLFFAFRKDHTFGYVGAMMIKVLWALLFFLGWLFAGIDRGYLSTVIWGGFAFIVAIIATWPEVEIPEGRK